MGANSCCTKQSIKDKGKVNATPSRTVSRSKTTLNKKIFDKIAEEAKKKNARASKILDKKSNFSNFDVHNNLKKLRRNMTQYKIKSGEEQEEKDEPNDSSLPPIVKDGSSKTLSETPKLAFKTEEIDKAMEEGEHPSVSFEEEEFKGIRDREIRESEESKGCYSDNEKEYDLGNVITMNQTGKISRALHFNTAKLIIVRTLEYSSLSEDQLRARLDYIQENLDLLSEIKSPNIIEFICADQDYENCSINVGMEFVPGGSLQNILKYFGTFKEKLAKIYIIQILDGLHNLHNNGFLHGDLKLSNVLVDDVGIVKLADFAFLKQTFLLEQADEPPEAFRSIITPLIHSEGIITPEMCKQDFYHPDSSFDIWCLGLILYEMLAGRPLFSIFEGQEEKLHSFLKELDEPPIIDINCSKMCQDFLYCCLCADHTKRATAEDLLNHPFLSLSTEERRESQDASNFISFFSIVASQASVNGDQTMSNVGVSIDNSDNMLHDSCSNPIVSRTMRRQVGTEKVNLAGSIGQNLPSVDLRVSAGVYKKFQTNKKNKSILSTGGINFEGLTQMSDNFNMGEYTNNSLHESVEQMQTGITGKEPSKFKSGNKLFLILRKLREPPSS
ncbi:unnamed protein product [Moneuplotes crassus]|uniref:Protein kinase domain-containing protein n=3 Tax=Euplotes crassus TaxID=5936 RepID=A0AAD2D8J2_EUPCR|nr:unnamed protein product [Moneuplotes crassus]